MSALDRFIANGGQNFKDASDQIKTWAREYLLLTGADAVTVSEINCRNAGCADVETAILVMRADEPTRMIRIACPLTEVSRADVVASIAGNCGEL